MAVADRFAAWIESVASAWSTRLAGWMVGWSAGALDRFLERNEPEAIGLVKTQLARLRNDPDIDAETKALIDKLLAGTQPLPVLLLIPLAILMLGPQLLALFQPVSNLLVQKEERVLRTTRMDPIQAFSAWRRDPKYQTLLDKDLPDMGWSAERIEAWKLLTEIIPGVSDLIRMSVREAFSPEIAEKFGQYQDPPTAVYPWAAKQGLSQEWVDRYWAAHWELPSTGQGYELLHRGIIKEDDLKLLLRALDVMPYWRDKLIAASWNVPTRVDVRRFWDMRTIDEARLREIYTALGYHGKDLEDYVLWTKIYVDFPDLLARYKNGWITIEDVKRELVAMGMSPDRAETLIQEKIKRAAPERTAKEKDITKADIIKGIKAGVISREQGAELLTDIGYSTAEAIYLLDVNIPVDEETATKAARELTKSDILAGLKAGVITEGDARAKLLTLRYSAPDTEFILRVYQAAATPPEGARLKEASKADIVTAVKRGLITQEAGYMMLLDIGFAADAAIFILSVATEESPFSPHSFEEFKSLTQGWRVAAGLEGKPMPETIKRLAGELTRLTAEVKALTESVAAEQKTLVGQEILPAAATARLTELQGALHRAQAELQRVRVDYNAKVIEWKHGLK